MPVQYTMVALSPTAAQPTQTVGGIKHGGKIFHERNPEHPNGEVLVVAGLRVEVAMTTAVRRALIEGTLVEVRAPASAPLPDLPAAMEAAGQEQAAEAAEATDEGAKAKKARKTA